MIEIVAPFLFIFILVLFSLLFVFVLFLSVRTFQAKSYTAEHFLALVVLNTTD